MTTEVYKISELEAFLSSDHYRQSVNLPVSPERVESYLHNPRSRPDMPVLFTMTDHGKIIAYRTILPDWFYRDDTPVEFAWLSGNFTDPAYRRKGHSSALLKIVEEAWEEKLMYTNYAPASKAVYDQSGTYGEFLLRPGRRYYLRASLHGLLKERFGIPGILKFSDRMINGIHDLLISGRKYPLDPDIHAEVTDIPDEELKKLIREHTLHSLFRRGPDEYNWIRNYPWITEQAASKLPGTYQFTRQVNRYSSRWYKLSGKNGRAFLWITIVGEKLSVPYFFCEDPLLVVAARQIVFTEMIDHKCAYLTIRHPELGPVLDTRGNPFLFSRMMPQRYFAHRSIAGMIPADPVVYDGDGDCVFT